MDKGIWVTGVGRASGPRDECTIIVGVEVRRPNAAAALADAADALEGMREVVLAAGLGASAMTTSGVTLNPVYDDFPTVAGFTAGLSLAIRTRDIDAAGSLLGRLVSTGGDAARVHEVSFTHSDPGQLEALARDAAWADALARAGQLAGLAGRQLGDVLSITESSTQAPAPRGGVRMMRAMAAGPPEVSLDAGEGTVSVNLAVGWSLR